MNQENWRPETRIENIVVQEMNAELLIYDLKDNRAFCLNETSAIIYQLCDGTRNIHEIVQRFNQITKNSITDDLIWLALDRFKQDNLLEDESIEINFNGLSRRQIIKKVGLASMIALPLVSSVIAPSAANAASVLTNLPLNSACTASSQCASGNCVNNSKCCSPSSTGTNAPASFFNFADGSPGSDCSTFSQSQQNAVCNSLFNAASCCNGTIIATSCFSFNPARFGCRCSPTP